MQLRVNVDTKSIRYNNENGLEVKISPDEHNGLSIVDGKIIATKAADGEGGSGGTMNICGNAIGPETAHDTDTISIAGMNRSVSRHVKCTDTTLTHYNYIHNNEGAVMVALDDDNEIDQNCVAYYMIHNNNGGGGG